MSGNKFIGCCKILDRTNFVLPDELKKFIPTRTKQQQMIELNEKKKRNREEARGMARDPSVSCPPRRIIQNNASQRRTQHNNSPRRSKKTRN